MKFLRTQNTISFHDVDVDVDDGDGDGERDD